MSCIEAKRVRESRWKKKKALTPKLLESSRGVAKPDENQREDNEWYEGAKRKQVKECCQKVKEQLLIEEIHAHEEKNGSYKTQGEFMKLINDMEANLDWKSFMYGMGKGTLKFLLNSSLNTLPTAANLKLWKKQTSNKCRFCNNIETTAHVLNGCQKFLQQGRYTWRHDNVLGFLWQVLRTGGKKVYADLPGREAPGGGTIPADILVTAERPDLVHVDRDVNTLQIFELTVPFESRIDGAHALKKDKYVNLMNDITDAGWTCNIETLEIGSRGMISKRNSETLNKMFKLAEKKSFKKKNFLNTISKLAILGSYKIWISRKEESWISPGLLQAN